MTYRWKKSLVHTPFVTDAQGASWLHLEAGDYDPAIFSEAVKAAINRVEKAASKPLDLALWYLPLKPPAGTTSPWATTIPLPHWNNITDISAAPAGVAVEVGNTIELSALPPPGAPSLAASSYRNPVCAVTAGEGAESGCEQERMLVFRLLTHVWENRGDEAVSLPQDIVQELATIGPGPIGMF